MPKRCKWKQLQSSVLLKTDFQDQKLNEMENAYAPLISTARNELASGGGRKAKSSKSCAVQGFCNDFVALFPRLCFQCLKIRQGKKCTETILEKIPMEFLCRTTFWGSRTAPREGRAMPQMQAQAWDLTCRAASPAVPSRNAMLSAE